ncbi:hypothetical protein CALVIDRAFT_474606 [Calocera viscosa TUFC12733]|uniref:RING-type domain-containing protein n=1 Tax=Calocera viscosa (strain TUFC12733) TaxID=1330018 RepID=A0A167SG80_CALVF|nr:hypothetical protein CALVIDRAFT_474606 [Calocera viscosa TUFC12733]
MTRSHSKNNTASSVFSYAEYKKLDYGTKRQRLGAESMRAFSACSLCLSRAREPVCCQAGHLYCRECVIQDLLEQKRDLRRYERRVRELEREEAAERERGRERARERVLREFERGQTGLGRREPAATGASGGEPRGMKRKLDLSAEAAQMAADAEAAALQAIEREQAEARRAKLPDFWLPSLTPDAPVGLSLREKDGKLETVCRASEPKHRMTLKSLIPVLFTVEQQAGGAEECICPSCKKTLGPSSLVCVMKRCGHVVCQSCVGELVRPSGQCVVCDGPAGEGEVVQVNREGTGYAAGGRAETSVKGVAFQG